MDFEDFAAAIPRIYHVAWAGALDGIKANGLRSTAALLDRFEVTPERRSEIAGHRRAEPVPLEHPRHGRAMIRDHGPISEKKLAGLLDDGMTPSDWYRWLDCYVFFWVDQDRVDRMLAAYPGLDQVVITFKAEVLRESWSGIRFTRINTGSTRTATRRGYATFIPAERFRVEDAKRIAEVCVPGMLRNIEPYVAGIAGSRASEPSS